KILSGQPEPLTRQDPDLPATLQSVVDRALEKQPEHRYADMEAMRQALEAARADVIAQPPVERRAVFAPPSAGTAIATPTPPQLPPTPAHLPPTPARLTPQPADLAPPVDPVNPVNPVNFDASTIPIRKTRAARPWPLAVAAMLLAVAAWLGWSLVRRGT